MIISLEFISLSGIWMLFHLRSPLHISLPLHIFCHYSCTSDIRGVAVDGVEGEPVNLTEPVTEAIAAAFAAWLLDRKKPDSSTRLKVSVGHDSRISAQKLQVSVICAFGFIYWLYNPDHIGLMHG